MIVMDATSSIERTMKHIIGTCILVVELSYRVEAWLFGTTTGSTIAPHNVTTLGSAPPKDEVDPVQAEMGAIIGAIFGVLFGVALIGFAGYMYIRQKRERYREYTRNSKVKMTSSRNAGVYVDTTVQEKLVPDDGYTFTSPDYKSVQKFQNPYVDDSDEALCDEEELWTSTLRG